MVLKKNKLLNFLVLFFILALLAGCSGWQISENSNTYTMAYGAGKAMGFGINRLFPQVDPELSSAWKDLMAENISNDVISADQMVLFYNKCVSIIALHTSDPYGAIGDLGVFLTIYGAQYDQDGKLISIQSVPRSVMKYFELGYINGRAVASRGDKSAELIPPTSRAG